MKIAARLAHNDYWLFSFDAEICTMRKGEVLIRQDPNAKPMADSHRFRIVEVAYVIDIWTGAVERIELIVEDDEQRAPY